MCVGKSQALHCEAQEQSILMTEWSCSSAHKMNIWETLNRCMALGRPKWFIKHIFIFFLRHIRSFGERDNICFGFIHLGFWVLYNTQYYTVQVFVHCFKVKTAPPIWICSKIVDQPFERLYQSTYHNNICRLANNIISDPNHVLISEYELLPSNRRNWVPRYNKVRLKRSFVHQSVSRS